jgi:hypothetical protein
MTWPAMQSVAETKKYCPSCSALLAVAGEAETMQQGSQGEGYLSNLDPTILELLQKIPTIGQTWPMRERVRWMRAFAMAISQLYDDPNESFELTMGSEHAASDDT